MPDREKLQKVLDLARWAPSGDNTQPWRFEMTGEDRLAVHGFDTRDRVLYDFDGHPSHMAHGALLETMRIAASGFSMACEWSVQAEAEARHPVYSVRFADAGGDPDPLLEFITQRAVQRRPMSTAPLSEVQRRALEAAAGEGFRVQFFETGEDKWRVGRLLWRNAHIRLTCPEAFPVHKEIIEWGVRFSKDRIPEPAVGVDPLTAKLMRWVMQDWGRVDFFNRFLAGTLVPRVQLDLLPALRCAAHILIRPLHPPEKLEDWVRLGAAMQRLWLTATAQGLHLQPEMTPVIFRWYVQANRPFSAKRELFDSARRLADVFETLAGAGRGDAFGFFCRVGKSAQPRSRSIRKDLGDLAWRPSEAGNIRC